MFECHFIENMQNWETSNTWLEQFRYIESVKKPVKSGKVGCTESIHIYKSTPQLADNFNADTDVHKAGLVCIDIIVVSALDVDQIIAVVYINMSSFLSILYENRFHFVSKTFFFHFLSNFDDRFISIVTTR